MINKIKTISQYTKKIIGFLLLLLMVFPSSAFAVGWTDQTAAGSRSWYGVASSSDGTKLVGVASGGYIYTSTDSGANWTQRTSAGSRSWIRVASSADGTKLLAAVYGGYLYTSTDSGANWTEQTSAGSRGWIGVASSTDGTKLVASVYGTYVFTSSDSGANWTQQTLSGSRSWFGVASSDDGTKLAGVVFSSGHIYTSTDSGVNWTDRTGAGSRDWLSVTSSSDGTKLAAVVSGGYIYTSSDSGANWTQQTLSGSRSWYSITSSSDGTKLSAVVNGGYIYISTDSGVNWTEQTSAGSRGWGAVASSTDGTKLIAGVRTGGDIWTYSSNTSPTAPSTLGPAGLVGGGYTNDNTPTPTFTLADPDGSDTVKFQIQIDDTSNFSSPVVDYTSALAAQGSTSFTVGQAAGSGTYTTGSSGQILTSGTSYYWQVKNIDNNTAESSYTTANSGAVAFIVDATAPVISEVTPVATPTVDTTPNYTFTTNEAGTISYGGDCTSGTTAASSGSNTITFSALADGTHSNCTIIVTDTATNASNTLAVTSFTVDTGAPVISDISVSTTFSSMTVTFVTDEIGSTILDYGTTGSLGSTTTEVDTSPRVTSHSVTLSGLNSCTTYYYRPKSNDASSNLGTGTIGSVTIACPGSVPLPLIFSNQPPQIIEPPIIPPVVDDFLDMPIILNRTLRYGNYGEDVKILQTYFNSHGFLVATVGAGSPGNETTFFGRATEAAVKKFQEAHVSEILAPYLLIKGTGIVGPTTREYINTHL